MAAAPKSVVVIGAGIIGVATAIWLRRAGHEVVLIDRNDPGEGTSYGNGGILASCSVVPVTGPGLIGKAPAMLLDPDSPVFLDWKYLPKLVPWLMSYMAKCTASETRRIAGALAKIVPGSLEEHQALAKGTPAERWIVESDYLYLYRNRPAFEADSFSWGLRRENGVDWEELDGAKLQKYDPCFAPEMEFAARMSNHGYIADPGQYVKDLAAHLEDIGGQFIKAEVSGFVVENGQLCGIVANGESMPADHAVAACGIWSKSLLEGLDLKVPMESERGYHVELLGPSEMPRAPVMIASAKAVVTPLDGRIRIAGIVEYGGLETAPSPAPPAFLIRKIKKAMPNLTWDEMQDWMGHRPAPVDSIPFLGAISLIEGLYANFGHHHIGLTAGPRSGRLLANLISGDKINVDLAEFRPDRFT